MNPAEESERLQSVMPKSHAGNEFLVLLSPALNRRATPNSGGTRRIGAMAKLLLRNEMWPCASSGTFHIGHGFRFLLRISTNGAANRR